MEAMDDRMLLEAAAMAVGFPCYRHGDAGDFAVKSDPMYGWMRWRPLTDDADAFRLAVRLRIVIQHAPRYVVAIDQACAIAEHEDGTDPAATRRAIVRAAAELGRAAASIGKDKGETA